MVNDLPDSECWLEACSRQVCVGGDADQVAGMAEKASRREESGSETRGDYS